MKRDTSFPWYAYVTLEIGIFSSYIMQDRSFLTLDTFRGKCNGIPRVNVGKLLLAKQ